MEPIQREAENRIVSSEPLPNLGKTGAVQAVEFSILRKFILKRESSD